MSENRTCYVEMMHKILHEGYSFSTLKNETDENSLAFCNMLILTACRNLTFIKNKVLSQFIKKKIPSKQQVLESVLYLGVTELLFMETPDYAVLNSYVDIAKKKTDRFGANFVNAVLRNILRHKEDLLKNKNDTFFGTDFRKILKKDYSDKEIKLMENIAQAEPPLDITFKHNIKPTEGKILFNGSVRFPANTKVVDIPLYNDGCWWVQDTAASMAVKCIKNLNGKKVLDVCAAPGGKTAQLLDGGAKVTALDVSEIRLKTLSENMKRLKFEKDLEIICTDALNFSSDEKFDVILLDAPCSATGTYRRHPEIMHTKNINDVKKQAHLQQKLLNHICQFLPPKGILVYATCSLAKDEGERQILNFINVHKDFHIQKISIGTKDMQTKDGFLRILPYHLADDLGADGFFVACLQRNI